MAITGALSVAELAAMMPEADGPYVFLSEARTFPQATKTMSLQSPYELDEGNVLLLD